MQGNKQVIDILNESLKHELGAINQYWLHYRMLDNWGYTKLGARARKESIEEMHHADKLVDRILFLEGHPNLQHVAPLMIGQNIKEVLECDLKVEWPPGDLAETGRNHAGTILTSRNPDRAFVWMSGKVLNPTGSS